MRFIRKFKYFVIFFVFLVCGVVFYQTTRKKNKFFLEVPLKESKNNDYYSLNIEIENKIIPLILDTGFQTTISLYKDTMESIRNKKKVGSITSYDVNGNEYKSPCYLIHSIKMGKIKITKATIKEQDLDSFAKGSELVKSDESASLDDIEESNQEKIGYLGVNMLRAHEYWLLDFPNSKMYMIGKLEESLKKLKISLEDFVEIPLQQNCPHIVISLDTDFGVKDFVLDSAANITIMRRPSENYSPHQTLVSEKFIANGHNLGEKKIYLFDFDSAFKFDGFLGIDFLKHRAVLIDFENNRVFIEKHRKTSSLKWGYMKCING